MGKIIELIKSKKLEENIRRLWSGNVILKNLLRVWRYLSLENDVLVVKEEGKKSKKVVPKQLVSLVLELFHENPLSGHRDFDKTFDLINSNYYWFGYRNEIQKFCESCFLCQTKKHLSLKQKRL